MFWQSQQPRSNNSQQHAQTVEQILAAIGIEPQTARVNTDRGYGWSFQRGSAMIEIYIWGEGNSGYLQVLSPIMHVPASALLPLYRKLLEQNMAMTNAALGIYLDIVYVFYERPLDGLDPSEANSIIDIIARYADALDNELVDEFGGRLYGQT